MYMITMVYQCVFVKVYMKTEQNVSSSKTLIWGKNSDNVFSDNDGESKNRKAKFSQILPNIFLIVEPKQSVCLFSFLFCFICSTYLITFINLQKEAFFVCPSIQSINTPGHLVILAVI